MEMDDKLKEIEDFMSDLEERFKAYKDFDHEWYLKFIGDIEKALRKQIFDND